MVLRMRVARLARQADDEIAVDRQPQLVAILGEALRHVDGGALLDVLENLLVAGLIADDQQPAAGFLHRLQRFVIGGDARGAGPGEVQLLQLRAQLDRARFAVVEGVVVEENFLQAREILERVAALRWRYRRPSAVASDARNASAATGRTCTCAGQPRVV